MVEELLIEDPEDDVELLLCCVEVGRSRSGRRSWRTVVEEVEGCAEAAALGRSQVSARNDTTSHAQHRPDNFLRAPREVAWCPLIDIIDNITSSNLGRNVCDHA